MQALLSGSKMAPESANFDKKGMLNAPPWSSGLITPVALRKAMMTRIHPPRQGKQTIADLM